jgi:hypothetical protein
MKKNIAIALLCIAADAEIKQDITLEDKVEYVLAEIEQHPEEHMNELYAFVDVTLENEPGLVYMVASQYWQDDHMEAQCGDCNMQPTLAYITIDVDPRTEATLDAYVREHGFERLAEEVTTSIAKDPIGNIGYLYLATAIAIRQAPNGVYMHGCRMQEEEFIERMQVMSFVLEQMGPQGFAYGYDLNHD